MLPASLALALCALAPGHNAVRPPVTDVGYDIDVSTRAFEVKGIDFNSGRVAFHHIYRLTGDEARGLAPGVDCGYEGLRPGEGEVYGLYDTGADRYEVVFAVRPPARSAEACATPEEAALAQKTLKAQLAHFGFDDKGPPPAVVPAPQGGFFPVPVQGRDRPVPVDVQARRATDEDFASDPVLEGLPEDTAVALARLTAGDEVLYTRYQLLESEADVGREITFLRLYLDEAKSRAVVLERFYHRPPNGAPRSLFSFSPVLDLAARLPAPAEGDAPAAAPTPERKKERKKRRAAGQEETCSEQCCGCGCMACVAPLLGGACGCALCVDGCSSLERRLLGDDDEYYEEIPPPERDEDDDKDEPEQYDVRWSGDAFRY